ncbi:MAG: gamma-glutamyltransferase [Hyphomicrobiales bacterium]|nr:gamma-glutamyltransferase [Hyphomicrobiales bacterium]
MSKLFFTFFLAVSAFATSLSTAQESANPAAEALISRNVRFHPVIGQNGMVATQDAIASAVGLDILKKGGNAFDAAVATGFAMAVTHPQAGNLGGGGFMLIALAKERKVIAIDYREMAPEAAGRDLFLGADGEVDQDKARFSHASAGVPGTVAGLIHVLENYGTMTLAEVLAPSIRLAEEGFEIPRGLAYALARNVPRFVKDQSSANYFVHPDGRPFHTGERLVQRDLAKTLTSIAKTGRDGFYKGWVADAIVAEMKSGNGLITHEDLEGYRVVEREPVRGTYRGHDIYSMPPPSSGGTHLVQMLNILEEYDLSASGHNSADTIHRMVEAMRRAYADRAEHMGDPDFWDVPVAGLAGKPYADVLRGGIDLSNASKSADISAGTPAPPESEQTTHFSIMDKDGNAVANTYTINFAFGSGWSVDGAGFLLNNEMDDFASKPGVPNAYGLIGGEANAIEARKRPLSSMTPTIVFKDGEPYLATGSPGGSTIITVVMQILMNVMDFKMNIAEATAAPRIHHQWLPDLVFTERGVSRDTLRSLEARGFILPKDDKGQWKHRILGRTNSILRRDGYLFGSSDPRAADGAISAY